MPHRRHTAVLATLLTGLSLAMGCTPTSYEQSPIPEQHAPSERHQYRAELSINGLVLDAQAQAFIPHTGDGKYARYVTQNIAYEPVAKLRSQIEHSGDVVLKHRGEAHITVVTPPEFERISSHLSIQQVNTLVEGTIQQSTFDIVCLGRGQVTKNGDVLSTYFLVVHSQELSQLRQKISRAYVDAGGSAPAFSSEFYPHITVGFTDRDLYESDGVIKNSDSCVAKVNIE